MRGREGVRFFEDLPHALAAAPAGEWRTHFHVPVHASRLGALGTTQGAILECLDEVAGWPAGERPILELETYAWSAMPEEVRGGSTMPECIAAEVRWLAAAMRARGLSGAEASP